MASGFDGIPSEIRVPFTYVEFDPSQADRGASSMPFHVLLAGQMLPTGEATELVPKRISAEAQAIRFFGEGSQLAQMAAAFLKANNMTRLTAIGIHDYAQGTAAIGSVEFSGAASVATPVCLYIGGERVRAGTSVGQTAAATAAALAQAVNANPGLAVTAAVDPQAAGKVILTARHKGEPWNDVDLRLGYGDEDFPAGLQAVIGPMSGGAGNPDAAEVVASMGGERYHVIALPWHDAASLDAFRDELDSRWGPTRQIDGQAVLVKTGTFAEVCTFAHARNDRHLTVIPSEGSPTLPWKDCAACVGVIARHGSDDPARPFQTLTVPGVLAPAVEDRWSDFPEKNQALYEGVSTRAVNDAGQVMFTALITTSRTNAWGAETQAYLYLNTLLTLSYLRYDWNNYIRTKYPRHKLANDDVANKYGNMQPIMTPATGRAEAVCCMERWMRLGLVEAPDDFKAKLSVERDADNPNRLNWFMSPDLVNQFRIAATKITFLL